MSDESLPVEIGRGKVRITPDLEIEVINLDNGQRLITQESMDDFLLWLNRGGDVSLVIDAKLEQAGTGDGE